MALELLAHVHSATLQVEAEVEVEVDAATAATTAAPALPTGVFRNDALAAERPPSSSSLSLPPSYTERRGSPEVAVRPSTISGAGLGAFGT